MLFLAPAELLSMWSSLISSESKVAGRGRDKVCPGARRRVVVIADFRDFDVRTGVRPILNPCDRTNQINPAKRLVHHVKCNDLLDVQPHVWGHFCDGLVARA